MTVQLSNGIIKSYDPEGSVSEKRGWLSMRMKEKKVLLFLALMFLCICSPMRAEARAEEPAAVPPEAEEALVPEAAVITVRIPTAPAEVPVR